VPEDIAAVEWPRDAGRVHLPALLAQAFGISSSDARRSIGQGGVRIDGQPLGDGTLDVDADQIDGKVLQLGKRRFVRVKLV
jgi:tyrosyl-tRNA synthetase